MEVSGTQNELQLFTHKFKAFPTLLMYFPSFIIKFHLEEMIWFQIWGLVISLVLVWGFLFGKFQRGLCMSPNSLTFFSWLSSRFLHLGFYFIFIFSHLSLCGPEWNYIGVPYTSLGMRVYYTLHMKVWV